MKSRQHALYRFFGPDNELLYIGITNHLPGRIREHSDDKTWYRLVHRVTVEHFPSRDAVSAAEKAAIKAERPIYNIVHNRRDLKNELMRIRTQCLAVSAERRAHAIRHELDARTAHITKLQSPPPPTVWTCWPHGNTLGRCPDCTAEHNDPALRQARVLQQARARILEDAHEQIRDLETQFAPDRSVPENTRAQVTDGR